MPVLSAVTMGEEEVIEDEQDVPEVPVADDGRIPVSQIRSKVEQLEKIIEAPQSGGIRRWKMQERVNEIRDVIDKYE